jgi:DNA-binding NtrC family response regulator
MNMNSDFMLREGLSTVGEVRDGGDAVATELTVPEKLVPGPRPTLRSMRAAAEIVAIRHALQETKWNRKRAAQLLSISYRGLLYKLRQHCIVQSEDQG